MPEVLRAAHLDTPRRLGEPSPALDPATERLVERRVAEAEERGRRAGEDAARAAVAEVADRAMQAVSTRLDVVARELGEQREAITAASIELARAAAEAVLGRVPPDDALTVLERVQEAVQVLDDEHLEVALHPEDHAALESGTVADPRLTLVADQRVGPGEAIVRGRHAGVELTRQALLDAAFDVLAAGGDA